MLTVKILIIVVIVITVILVVYNTSKSSNGNNTSNVSCLPACPRYLISLMLMPVAASGQYARAALEDMSSCWCFCMSSPVPIKVRQ